MVMIYVSLLHICYQILQSFCAVSLSCQKVLLNWCPCITHICWPFASHNESNDAVMLLSLYPMTVNVWHVPDVEVWHLLTFRVSSFNKYIFNNPYCIAKSWTKWVQWCLKGDCIEVIYTTLLASPFVGRCLDQALYASKDYSNVWCNVIKDSCIENSRWHRCLRSLFSSLYIIILMVYYCQITAPSGGILSKTMQTTSI